MKTKNLGIILIILGLLIGGILFRYMGRLNTTNRELGCYQASGCTQIGASFSISHIAVGVIAFLFALGLYMALFSKSESAVMDHLKEKTNKEFEKKKFDFALGFLDENEKRILKSIMEQDGIKQDILAIKTNLSGAKVSRILSIFEKKGIISKEKSGNTYSIYLKKG